MATLTPELMAALAVLRTKFGDDREQMATGRLFADGLRAALPDVDDSAIAAVLMLAGAHAIGVAQTAHLADDRDTAEGEAAMHALAATFGAAALDLTSLHWRKETP